MPISEWCTNEKAKLRLHFACRARGRFLQAAGYRLQPAPRWAEGEGLSLDEELRE
jgi:hypothetical protein